MLSKTGINQIMDLTKNQKTLSINDINSRNIKMLENFELASMVKCLPKQWEEEIYTQVYFLSFNCQLKRDKEIEIKSKYVYKNIIKEITTPPLSEKLFQNNFDITNDFGQIYWIPFNATIYTKLRSFQFKINRNILYTNNNYIK